jgi:putative cardiolipin synthase
MHNKTFTVDNQITIIGGRNIAAEYFAARTDINFGDLDAVGIGPVVQDVSRQFDTYWNDPFAVPVPAFIAPPESREAALSELRKRLSSSRDAARETPYGEALVRAVKFIDETKDDDFTWAPYELVYDSPAKARGEELAADESILTPLRKSITQAEQEFMLVSPYFVARNTGVEGLAKLRARGVDVKVITNSLASTNHSVVHTGYAPSRKPLLHQGVKLFEVRPDTTVTGAEAWSGGRISKGTRIPRASWSIGRSCSSAPSTGILAPLISTPNWGSSSTLRRLPARSLGQWTRTSGPRPTR